MSNPNETHTNSEDGAPRQSDVLSDEWVVPLMIAVDERNRFAADLGSKRSNGYAMPYHYPRGRGLRGWELQPDCRAEIRQNGRGGIIISGADDSHLRLSLSGSQHLALRVEEAEEYQAGIVLDRGRVEWLREVLGMWLESGRIVASEKP